MKSVVPDSAADEEGTIQKGQSVVVEHFYVKRD